MLLSFMGTRLRLRAGSVISVPGVPVPIGEDRPRRGGGVSQRQSDLDDAELGGLSLPATSVGGGRGPQLSQDNHAVTAVQRSGGVLRLGAPEDAMREQGGHVAPMSQNGAELPSVGRDRESGDSSSCCGVTKFGFGCQVPDCRNLDDRFRPTPLSLSARLIGRCSFAALGLPQRLGSPPVPANQTPLGAAASHRDLAEVDWVLVRVVASICARTPTRAICPSVADAGAVAL